jgi:hypothetical protein
MPRPRLWATSHNVLVAICFAILIVSTGYAQTQEPQSKSPQSATTPAAAPPPPADYVGSETCKEQYDRHALPARRDQAGNRDCVSARFSLGADLNHCPCGCVRKVGKGPIPRTAADAEPTPNSDATPEPSPTSSAVLSASNGHNDE